MEENNYESSERREGFLLPAVSRLSAFCDRLIFGTILLLSAAVPLFFLPFTLEVAERNKQLLLAVAAVVVGLAWAGKMLAERRFEYRRSVANLAVLLFAAAYAASAVFSKSPYISAVGGYGQEMSGLLTVASLVVIYFAAASNLRTARAVEATLTALVAGGLISGILAALNGMGLFILPFEFAESTGFNTVGTAGALCLYQAFTVILAGGLMVRLHLPESGRGRAFGIAKIALLSLAAAVGLFLIAALDFWPVSVSLLVGATVLLGFAFYHAKSLKGLGRTALPIAAFLVSVLILVFPSPYAIGFPAEVMPSTSASVTIASETFKESPFLGSGPGTFAYQYAKHRPAKVNETVFWDIRFDRGSSRFLTAAATTGLIGTLSWLILLGFLAFVAVRRLVRAGADGWAPMAGMAAAWSVLAVGGFLYSSTASLEFAFWMATALLVIAGSREFLTVRFEDSPRAAMSLSFVFILGAVFAVSGGFAEANRYAADVRYAQALRGDQAGAEVDETLDGLLAAVRLNPRNDEFFRSLGAALLAKANEEAAAAPDTERQDGEEDADYEARMKSESDDRLRLVAALAGDAVNASVSATERNPDNVANWKSLAAVYREMFGMIPDADVWAVKAYEKAIELEPANPLNYGELGQVYIYQADQKASRAAGLEGEEKSKAEKERDDLYVKAVETFRKAIENKSEYAAAHFYLGVALERQGKLKEAIGKMEETLAYSPQDVGVGFQLALLYYRDGRIDDAAEMMEAVIALSPKYSDALWYLASMMDEKGNLDRAIELVERVAEINPEAQVVRERLESLKAKRDDPEGWAARQSGEGGELPPPLAETEE